MNKKHPKIFCIGLSRTGTTTLHLILKKLGLKSIHFCNFLLAEEPDLKQCDEFDALGDTPVPLLFKELDSQYPDSKFIITVRQKEKWLESMKWMLEEGEALWNWEENVHEYHKKFYGTRSYDEKILAKHWDAYHENAMNYFSTSPERLLIIKLENGFNVYEICEFLELPYREITVRNSNARRSIDPGKRIK